MPLPVADSALVPATATPFKLSTAVVLAAFSRLPVSSVTPVRVSGSTVTTPFAGAAASTTGAGQAALAAAVVSADCMLPSGQVTVFGVTQLRPSNSSGTEQIGWATVVKLLFTVSVLPRVSFALAFKV